MTTPLIHEKVAGLVRGGSDITLRQLLLMMECRSGNRTVRDLSASMSVDKPAITRAADRCAEWEFVTRKKDGEDRRSIFICLTPKGRKFIDAFMAA